MKTAFLGLLCVLLLSCNSEPTQDEVKAEQDASNRATSLIVLGTVQDAGSPHAACVRACCKDLFDNPDPTRQVVSLGVVDPETNKTFLFEATPDLPTQMKVLTRHSSKETPDGIFLTHAHIGHYSGLMYLGRESMNAEAVPVYAMPRMKSFLENSGPWSQLVELNNIALQRLGADSTTNLTPNVRVTPFLVPHRDEFSETVGYRIAGPNKSALFIPDIDKWEKWNRGIVDEVSKVDYAFVDATFYDGAELNNRDMSEIPHPFIVESMQLFDEQPASEKAKIYFTHFNHTNPVLDLESEQAKQVLAAGFSIAEFGMALEL